MDGFLLQVLGVNALHHLLQMVQEVHLIVVNGLADGTGETEQEQFKVGVPNVLFEAEEDVVTPLCDDLLHTKALAKELVEKVGERRRIISFKHALHPPFVPNLLDKNFKIRLCDLTIAYATFVSEKRWDMLSRAESYKELGVLKKVKDSKVRTRFSKRKGRIEKGDHCQHTPFVRPGQRQHQQDFSRSFFPFVSVPS